MHRQYPVEAPEPVTVAKRRALDVGFELRPEGNRAGGGETGPSACLDEVGALLRALTAARPGGLIGEVGTGAGVGAAWIASGLAAGARLVTVEIEPALAQAAAEVLADHGNVEVVSGDWLQVMPARAPFDLVFFDGGGREALARENWPLLAALLKPGGIMILDDLTPEELWPDEWRGKPDPKRELAFGSGLFTACELRSRPDISLLMLVRNPPP